MGFSKQNLLWYHLELNVSSTFASPIYTAKVTHTILSVDIHKAYGVNSIPRNNFETYKQRFMKLICTTT